MYVSMIELHGDLHSPVRRRKYDVVKIIIQATGGKMSELQFPKCVGETEVII